MKRIFLIIWLLVSSPAAGQTVSLQARNSKFMTDVVLNDQLNVRALVDLGATTTILCDGMARSLNLPRGERVMLRTVGKRVSAQRTRLRSIRLETIKLDEVDALVISDRWCDEMLLGLSILRRLRLTMEDDTLILSSGNAKSECGDAN